jgi:single-stranded DNA-binding protein
MIAALIQGTLAGDPMRRTSPRNGAAFATASVRVAVGAESIFVGVTVFDETATERLMRLSKGAAVAAAGTLELNAWVDREGKDRRDWRLTAHEILSVHQARRRRAAAEETES